MNEYYAAAFMGAFLTAVAQVFLKYGAIRKKNRHFFSKFYNPFSLAGYFTFVIVTLLNLYALQEIRLIDMVYIVPLSFVLVLLGSRFIFGEKLSIRQVVGFFILLFGIVLFNIG